jgi:sterol desaturase/sphingolipid hydroxylase (fatty acid hydroxylase superfamily)
MDVDLTLYSIPAFIVLMLVEGALSARSRVRGYEAKDTATSLAMGLGNASINLFMAGVQLLLLTVVSRAALFDIGGTWWDWIILLIATDFCYYWFHRLHHDVRLLWAAHVNHHSSQLYNLSTALRQSWTTPFTTMLFYWPLALLGFHPLMILSAIAINTVYQFWIHTELIDRVGPFEWIFNTPSHHRVHHGTNIEYLDRNHAGMLIIWDKLFGTFEPEGARVRYGLTKNIDTYNPVRVAFHEWVAMIRDARAAGSWSDSLRYLVQPPGWSPDGSTLTANQMRARSAI